MLKVAFGGTSTQWLRTAIALCRAFCCLVGLSSAVPKAMAATVQISSTALVTISGVTAYDPQSLASTAAARLRLSNRAETVEALADTIEVIYRQDGFLFAEVAVLKDPAGRKSIAVDEGVVDAVKFDGLKPDLARAVSRILAPAVREAPVRQKTFERSLALASDLAGVQLQAHLAPEGDKSILFIEGSVRKQSGVAGVEMIPTRPGYALRGFVSQEFYGLGTPGDLTRLTGLVSRENGGGMSVAAFGTYRAPVSADGTYIELYAGNVVGRRTFSDDQTTYRLRGFTAGALIGLVTRRDLQNFSYLIVEGEYQKTRSLFGLNQAESEAFSTRLHWTHGYDYVRGGILRWGLTASAGVRPDDDKPTFTDGPRSFAHLRGEFGMVRVISRDSNSTIRFDGRAQISATTLPEVERFSMGHAPFLRSYAPAEVEGDSGISGTIEFSRAFENLHSGRIESIAPFAFLSGGVAWLEKPRQVFNERRSWQIASAGIGADLRFGGWQMSSWIAFPFSDGPRTAAGDPAFYFSITRGW